MSIDLSKFNGRRFKLEEQVKFEVTYSFTDDVRPISCSCTIDTLHWLYNYPMVDMCAIKDCGLFDIASNCYEYAMDSYMETAIPF